MAAILSRTQSIRQPMISSPWRRRSILNFVTPVLKIKSELATVLSSGEIKRLETSEHFFIHLKLKIYMESPIW